MKLVDLIFDKEISRLDTIKRWDLNQIIKEETVTSHSYWVTFFANVLAELVTNDSKLKLLIIRYALIHDLPEIFSGDVNHVVKRNKYNGEILVKLLDEFTEHEMNNKFQKPETKILNDLFIDDWSKSREQLVKDLVKFCDWISFFRFLLNEKNLGNTNLLKELKYCTNNIINICSTIHHSSAGFIELNLDCFVEIKKNMEDFLYGNF